MKEIDTKDKKILFYLSQNSRQPLSSLAKKVGLSKNSVTYRVERLKKLGVVANFLPIIDLGKFGYNTYDMFIKLNVKSQENEHIINELKSLSHITWLVSLSGEWDMMVEFAAKEGDFHLQDVIEKIILVLGPNLEQYEIHISRDIIKVDSLLKDFLGDMEFPTDLKPKNKPSTATVDELDKTILATISQNSAISNEKLALLLHTSSDTIRYRIKKLEQTGIILSHGLDINHAPLGYNEYIVNIRLRKNSQKEIKELEKYLKGNKNILYAFAGLTKLEIVMFVLVKSPLELDSVLKDVKNTFFSIVDSYQTMLVIKTHTYNLFPKGLVTD